MKTLLPARDVFCHDGEWSPRLYRGSVRKNGRTIVTDRRIVLYAGQLLLDPAMPTPVLSMVRGIFGLLVCPYRPDTSDRLFRGSMLDTLEGFGYAVRPLTHPTALAHAIVRNKAVVGLLMPMHPDSINPALGDRTAR